MLVWCVTGLHRPGLSRIPAVLLPACTQATSADCLGIVWHLTSSSYGRVISIALQGLQSSSYGQGNGQGASQMLHQQNALAALGPTQQAALLRRVSMFDLESNASFEHKILYGENCIHHHTQLESHREHVHPYVHTGCAMCSGLHHEKAESYVLTCSAVSGLPELCSPLYHCIMTCQHSESGISACWHSTILVMYI